MSSKENNIQRVPEEIKKDDIGYSERFHDPPIGDGKMGEVPPLSKSAPTGGSWDDYMDKPSTSKTHRRSGSSDMKKNQTPGEPMLKRHPRERGDRGGGGGGSSSYYTDDRFMRDSDHPPPPPPSMHPPMFRVEQLTHQDVQAILMENYNLKRDMNEMQHQFRAERSDLHRRLRHTMARLFYLEDRQFDMPEYGDMGKPFPPMKKGYRSSRHPPLGPPPPLNRNPIGPKDNASESYNIQPPQEAYKDSRVTGNEQHYAPESPEPITHADLKKNGRKEDVRTRSFSDDRPNPIYEPYRYGKPFYDMSPQDRLGDYDPEMMYGPRKMYPYPPYDQDEFYDEDNYSSEEEYPKRAMRGPPMHSLPPMSMSMMPPPPPPPPMPPMGYPPPQQQSGWMMDDIPYGDPRGQMMPPPPPPPPGSIHRSSSKRSQLGRHGSKRKPMTAEEEEEIMLQQEQQFGDEDDPEMQMLMQQMSMGQPPMGRYPPMMRPDMYMMGGNRMPPPPPPPLPPGPPGPPGPPMMENLMYDDFGPSSIRRVPSHRSVPGGSARSSYLGSR
ncbi:hypothetical protein K501DRAFT_282456 [Backusella circina FSU 941]|nr:hypothetical protein K501DRAFT_282456 [Backusella circina FSU 941]